MSDEEGLQPRVWLAMKDYLTNKYQHFEELVRECYRQQQLAFSSKELKDMYSRVEQKWAAKTTKKER
jgi:exonuclease VII large subunit